MSRLCGCGCGEETAVIPKNHAERGYVKGENYEYLAGHQGRRHGHRNRNGNPGACPSLTYTTWQTMKQRCLNENHDAYPRYGGRGIAVCERWLTFENFLIDMGERPEGTSLDRIDNDGNYEPRNCRWADSATQNKNRRRKVAA